MSVEMNTDSSTDSIAPPRRRRRSYTIYDSSSAQASTSPGSVMVEGEPVQSPPRQNPPVAATTNSPMTKENTVITPEPSIPLHAKKRSLTTEEHKVKVSIEETRKPSPSKTKLVTSPASVNHRESKDSPATRHMKKPSRRKPAPPPLPRPDQENIDNQASVKIREKRRSETPLKSVNKRRKIEK